MPQNIFSQKNIMIVVGVVVLLLAGGAYYWYSSSSDPSTQDIASFDASLLNKDEADFYAVKDRVQFGDLSFMKRDLYNNLENNTVDIPMVIPKGRDNPYFLPYATP